MSSLKSRVARCLKHCPTKGRRDVSLPPQFLQRKLQPGTCLAITQLAARHALHDLTAQVMSLDHRQTIERVLLPYAIAAWRSQKASSLANDWRRES